MLVSAAHGIAQQDEGPILRPKKPPAKPADATLLVMCDLACNWRLDGEAKGHIEAGRSAKAKVELGQHIVLAVTEDGADKAENDVEIKTAGQAIARFELQPVRDARLKIEQDARNKADQEARDKAAKEQREKAAREEQERDRKAREQVARERQEREQKEREQAAQAEAAGLVWTDPATGLMWTKKDSRDHFNFREASEFCQNLQLAGVGGWRLPTIDELTAIYDPNQKVGDFHVEGNLQLSGWEWSSSPGGAGEGWLLIFRFNFAKRVTDQLEYNSHYFHALCVRRSGQR
jgi:hypothetical protein